jgi:hypothetical protein
VVKLSNAKVEQHFKDASGEVRTLAILCHEHGWDAQLDGEPITVGAFRDICALLEASTEGACIEAVERARAAWPARFKARVRAMARLLGGLVDDDIPTPGGEA